MNAESAEVYYLTQKKEWETNRLQLEKKRRRIAWLRFLIVVLTGFFVSQTWQAASAWLIGIEITIGLAAFLFIISKDTNAGNEIANLNHLLAIVENESNMLLYNFKENETGTTYMPAQHPYAADLDVFGKASLFQYINRCTSEQGKQLLANRLLFPLSKQNIEEEQKSVQDVCGKPFFIHQLLAFGKANPLTKTTEEKIKQWLQLPLIYTHPNWRWLALIFPFISAGIIVLYATDVIASAPFYLLLFACYLFSAFISKNINETYDVLYKTSTEINTLQKQLQWIESQSFSSVKMVRLQEKLLAQNKSVAAQTKRLSSILNRFDIRLNHFAFFFFNTLFLWDLQQLLAINKWKKQNEDSMAHWFDVIAETEVCCSVATLQFNKPTWVMPAVTNSFFHLQGNDIAHPLLPETKSVANTFLVDGKGKIAIITGSNMGGKSTFLRSLGTNVVLALMGAPVCAKQFSVSCIALLTSMRVTDNLSESTSTFYAELKTLKTILDAVKSNLPAFILLDEILRGTNSLDRHAGSVALLTQLIKKEAVAVIATHDIELAKLEKQYPEAVQNYHFDVQATNDELYFDYKLKPGVCRSMNASILMKNIGIDIE